MNLFVVVSNTECGITVDCYESEADAEIAANNFAKDFYGVDDYQKIAEVSADFVRIEKLQPIPTTNKGE